MFTQAEIKQYQDVYKRWYQCDKYAIPARYSRNVIDHAVAFGFVRRAENYRTVYVGKCGHYTGLDLPVEVLWAFVKPVAEKATGFSIAKDEIWQFLNFDKGDINSIERVLITLDQAGYITFQSSGNIWRIDLRQGQS